MRRSYLRWSHVFHCSLGWSRDSLPVISNWRWASPRQSFGQVCHGPSQGQAGVGGLKADTATTTLTATSAESDEGDDSSSVNEGGFEETAATRGFAGAVQLFPHVFPGPTAFVQTSISEKSPQGRGNLPRSDSGIGTSSLVLEDHHSLEPQRPQTLNLRSLPTTRTRLTRTRMRPRRRSCGPSERRPSSTRLSGKSTTLLSLAFCHAEVRRREFCAHLKWVHQAEQHVPLATCGAARLVKLSRLQGLKSVS